MHVTGLSEVVEFRLLGPFEIAAMRPVSIPRRRERGLLAVLLLEHGRVLHADRLVDLLWDGDPPPTARQALSSHVSRVRAALGSAVRITRHGAGYQLHTDPESIDAHRFRSLVRLAGGEADPERRVRTLRSALELWRGPVLTDVATGVMRERLGAELDELRLAALDQRISADLSAGRHDELIAELRQLVNAHPNQDRFTAHLMLALYRAGRQTDALEAFAQTRRRLADEFGLNPRTQLRNLHERILRADPGLDLPAPAAAPSGERRPPRQLPHDITRFTGRDEELARLDALVRGRSDNGTAPVIVSITGAPGTGKTTLAVHWAHRMVRHFPAAQLYVNLRGHGPCEPVTAATAVGTLLRALGVPGHRVPSDVEESSALLRSTVAGRQVLLLLDNARDANQVRPLLPGSGGLIIVTSRHRLRSLSIRDGAHQVSLSRLPPDQATALLAATAGSVRVAAEPEATSRLVRLCDRLPLALAIAAERARHTTLTGLADALEEDQARLDILGDEPHTGVRAAVSWSYQALTAEAATLFRALGLHPTRDFDLHTAAALSELPTMRAAALLDELVSANLVEQGQHHYEMLDLIRLCAADLARTR